MVEEEQEERRPTGPHPCALPAHIVLLLSVVVALGMHASAMLFCEVSCNVAWVLTNVGGCDVRTTAVTTYYQYYVRC